MVNEVLCEFRYYYGLLWSIVYLENIFLLYVTTSRCPITGVYRSVKKVLS